MPETIQSSNLRLREVSRRLMTMNSKHILMRDFDAARRPFAGPAVAEHFSRDDMNDPS
jgi:hypothetical protein